VNVSQFQGWDGTRPVNTYQSHLVPGSENLQGKRFREYWQYRTWALTTPKISFVAFGTLILPVLATTLILSPTITPPLILVLVVAVGKAGVKAFTCVFV
jgi:hypothetical protein